MKRIYSLALTGRRLSEPERKEIMEKNRAILSLPAAEFVRRVHELQFIAVTESK